MFVILCIWQKESSDSIEYGDSTSIVFTLKEEVGALARALKLFEVCTETNNLMLFKYWAF